MEIKCPKCGAALELPDEAVQEVHKTRTER